MTAATCPRCGGAEHFVVDGANLPDGQSANGVIALAVAAAYLPAGKGGFFGTPMEMRAATTDAWICASCGFVDLYVRDVGALAELVARGAPHVRKVGG